MCTVCHRLMYKEAVAKVQVAKYKKTSNLIKCLLHNFILKGWICKKCDTSLLKGRMPIQAKANGLELDSVPDELSDLNALEL